MTVNLKVFNMSIVIRCAFFSICPTMKTTYSCWDKFELQISISRMDIGTYSTRNVRQDTKMGSVAKKLWFRKCCFQHILLLSKSHDAWSRNGNYAAMTFIRVSSMVLGDVDYSVNIDCRLNIESNVRCRLIFLIFQVSNSYNASRVQVFRLRSFSSCLRGCNVFSL